MAEKKILVLDASVAVKWFTLEPLRDKALAIRNLYLDGKVELEAPSLLLYEVSNALRYNPSFGIEDLKAVLSSLNDLQLTLHDLKEELAYKAAQVAYNFGITFYDACYVALAELRGGTLYTTDLKVVEDVSAEYVKHLSEFPTPAY